MARLLQEVITLAGRVLLCAIFLLSAAANKIPNYNETLAVMESRGVPAPQILLPGAIAFLILGSLSVMLGLKARIGALMLIVFLVLATYYFHDFWKIDPTSKEQQKQYYYTQVVLDPAERPKPGKLDEAPLPDLTDDEVASLQKALKMKKTAESIQAMKNLAILGALLFILANGSGPISLDRVLPKQKKKSE